MNENDSWVIMSHPSVEADLRAALTPKERWKMAYRSERMQRNGRARELVAVGGIISLDGFGFIVEAKP